MAKRWVLTLSLIMILVPVPALAQSSPAIEPLEEQVQLRLVHCQNDLDCWLAGALLSKGFFIEEYPLEFDNPGQEEVQVSRTSASAKGEYSGIIITDGEELGLPNEATFPAQEVASLPLTIDRDAIYPDHYTGTIYLTPEGGAERLTLPLDLNVRAGPLWAIFFLAVGIFLGQIVRIVDEKQPDTKRSPMQVLKGEAGPLKLLIKTPLVLGLLYVGLATLYEGQQGSTLGANPLSDYLILLVWGLGSDVAGRTITKLRG